MQGPLKKFRGPWIMLAFAVLPKVLKWFCQNSQNVRPILGGVTYVHSEGFFSIEINNFASKKGSCKVLQPRKILEIAISTSLLELEQKQSCWSDIFVAQF